MQAIEIGGRLVGSGHPCYVIAEAGVNHNGKVDVAKRLVDVAKSAGADAVKFQLFRADEQVSVGAQTAKYQSENTGASTMLEMAKTYDLPWEAHKAIAEHCREVGIAYLASCFDTLAVDFFVSIGGTAIKVGSGEITNFPLLRHISKTGKPILLSTGMSTLGDVESAVLQIRSHGSSPIALFHCVSNYPTPLDAVNLRVIKTLRQAFNVPVGFSDHTEEYVAAIAAVALGASLIEKHFTVDQSLPGPDHVMSLSPQQLKEFVRALRSAEICLGDGVKRLEHGEADVQRAARRSLVSRRKILAGEPFTEENVTLKRPATGIDPRLWETVRGRKAAAQIPSDVPIMWDMVQ